MLNGVQKAWKEDAKKIHQERTGLTFNTSPTFNLQDVLLKTMNNSTALLANRQMENKFIFHGCLLVMLKENRGRNWDKKSRTTVLYYFRRTPKLLREEETGGVDLFN